MNKKIIFITGGARSGKSSFALAEASHIKGLKAYIATAESLDEEMEKRIEKHRKDRGNDWDTFEEPLKIAQTLQKTADDHAVVLLDCLTLWVSNLLHAGVDIQEKMDGLINALMKYKTGTGKASVMIIVSNEVGMGIVPGNEMAREFRDWAGILNQKVASAADEVYVTVSGIPVKIKGNSSAPSP